MSFRRAFWCGVWSIVVLVSLTAPPATAAEPEEAQYNVVVTLYNAGQWQAALNRIAEREKLELSPTMKARYQFVRALAYERGGKADEAKTAYEQLIAKYPNAPEVPSSRVAILYLDYTGAKYDSVVVNYSKIDLTKLPVPEQKNVALMYAESLYARKEDKAALAAYQKATQLGVDQAQLAGKLFGLYSRMGMHAELLAISTKGVTGIPAEVVALARAESQLALKKWTEAETEAAKVPKTHALYARAEFARAQSFLRQNKLKEALTPLETAVAGLKDPPAPPAAYIALAECLLEAGRAADAPKALATAEQALPKLPEADRKKFQGQIVLLRLRATAPKGDRKALIKSITDSRATFPAEQLSKVLYMRLYALSEEKDHATILATMATDLPIFQGTTPAATDELGPATLIYMSSLRDQKRSPEAVKLLDDLIRRKAAAPEILKGRLILANEALSKDDFAAAKAQFEAVAAVPQAQQQLGKATFDELQYNRAVTAHKTNQPDPAAAILRTIIATQPPPAPDLIRQSQTLLGQILANKNDYAGATAIWKQALPNAKPAEEADLRDRLARVLFAAKDYPGALEQLPLAAKAAGEKGLSREGREVWARTLFVTNKFEESAAMYKALAETFKDMPGYAYECAVAFEKAGKPADAEKWYAVALEKKAKLPEVYAKAIDANLAAARFKSGQGDMGAAQWLNQLTTAKDDKAFDSAFHALRRVIVANKLDAASRGVIEAAMKPQPPAQLRRFALGALLVEAQFTAGEKAAAGKLAAELLTQFTDNEKKFDANALKNSIAPAVLYFYRGEALRAEKNFGDSLAAYLTVRESYPINEWYDAATCGVAESFLGLGDKESALKSFQEVVDAKGAPAGSQSNPAANRWRDLAKQRLADLAKEKGK